MSDEQAIKDMAQRYSSLCGIWDAARAKKGEAA
jgi:5-dehydro-2-deoxygluconokinase